MNIQIEYKRIRGIYLRVDPTNHLVRVSAPYGISREYIEQVIEKKRDWIEQRLTQPVVSDPALAAQELKEKLNRLIPYWEDRMGLHATAYTIKFMKTRWGSCNIKSGRISLNLQLAAYPERCLEYVLVHELAHLRVAAHNQEFWKLVESHIPEWREIRASMR